jgi:hypothetical protein
MKYFIRIQLIQDKGNYLLTKRFISVILVFFSGFLISCEEKSDLKIEPGNLNTIVVDAIITNEYQYQTIILSRPYPDANGKPAPVTGAAVEIIVEDKEVKFPESELTPGVYLSEYPTAAAIDKIYTLRIKTKETEYEAMAEMIPVIPQYPLEITPSEGETDLYTITWTAPLYNPDDLAMYEVEIDWTHLVDPALTDTLTRARMMHYTLNTIDVSYMIFPQDKEEVFFPAGSILTVKKYSVNSDYGNYLRALLAEAEWQGSIFEDARGNLPTNISNGGLGYFSLCSVVSNTSVVQ